VVEEVLYQFAGVREAAVVGMPDSRKGEQPVAFVVPNEGVTLDEKGLRHFLRRKLADYKIPRKIVLLEALPRNATGKILKTNLREMPLPNSDITSLCAAIAYTPIPPIHPIQP
jgi:long-chain acyl-CoA synthetase